MEKEELIINEIKKVKLSDEILDKLKGKTVLVTGGNGLIGSYLLNTLVYYNEEKHLGMVLVGTVRDFDKCSNVLFRNKIKWEKWILGSSLELNVRADYIIHTANSTSSKYFTTNPVELINEGLHGFNEIVKYAMCSNSESIIYTSSLEVYGICTEDRELSENEYYPIDAHNVRSSYPLLKKILENLCSSYAKEYNIDIKSVRLGQVFAPGVNYNDGRVFAEFGRSVIAKNDIVLKTKGETKHSYCSMPDAISGILLTLIKGNMGESYNCGSDNSYISIYELAKLFAKDKGVNVIIKEEANNSYLPTVQFALNTDKIKLLGFKSVEDINQMVDNLIAWFECVCK